MGFETVDVYVEDGVGIIRLQRPVVLNAFNQQMGRELYQALKIVEKDTSVRAVLIMGSGRAFCAGQDLTDASAATAESLADAVRERYLPIITKMRHIRKPIVAAVHGAAAGAGASLALAADLRVASESAVFTLAFSKIGLVPDSGASYFLPRLIGVARAMELVLTARPVKSAEALQIGLVNRVVPDDQFETESLTWAKELAKGATKALGWSKELIYQGSEEDLLYILEKEAQFQDEAGHTSDFREGIQAFLEKRASSFTGQ